MRPSPSAERALTSRIVPHFQPIVSLDDRSVVGYEALARWPDVPDARPDEVFAAARAQGMLADLDWRCRRAAIETAQRARIRKPLSVFVNVEPSTLRTPPQFPFSWERFREITRDDLQVVIELTERDLLADPRGVVETAEWARANGCGIAVDDVGVNPESLMVLPLVLPDVVKLDRAMITDPGGARYDETMSFVADYAAFTGARVIAEGIETDHDVILAALSAASLGQGFLLGKPASPSEIVPTTTTREVRLFDRIDPPLRSPAEILDRTGHHVSTYGEIARVFDEMHAIGALVSDPGCLLVGVQDPTAFVDRFGAYYAALARKHTLVGVVGMHDVRLPGVRHSEPDDPGFAGEFATVVVTSHYSAAVVARDLGDHGPLEHRRYAWTLTHDRAAVRAAATCLFRRLAPLAGVDVRTTPLPVQ